MKKAGRRIAWPCLIAGWLGAAAAQTPPATDAAEQRRLQERIELQRERLEPRPEVRLGDAPREAPLAWPDNETPCFFVERVQWPDLPEGWAWLPAQVAQGPDSPVGRCLGAQGLAVAVERAQALVVQRGFVTSRVVPAAQRLLDGELRLHVLVGRVGQIRLHADADAQARLAGALPLQPGDPLDLRAIEQGLENLQRLPSVEADIELEATGRPFHSDVVVRWRQRRPWRLAVSLDDAGSRSTGLYQGAITLSRDHGLRLNDLFYLTLQHDAGGGDPGERGTRGATVHYSVPLGRQLLAFTSSQYRYRQTVPGAFQSYRYAGEGQTHEARLTHLLQRDAASKTLGSLRVTARESRNFIDDTEIRVQRRRTAAWALGVAHKTRLGTHDIDLDLSHQQGMSALGGQRAPEEAFGEGSSRARLWQADLNAERAFTAGGQRWQHSQRLRAQHHDTRLTAPDRFAIGGRHSVRGFDGDSTLSGDSGWFWRQEIALALGEAGAQVYLGLDRGCVSGPAADGLAGRCLTGTVLGVRGRVGPVFAETFLGWPLRHPEGFKNRQVSGGFQLYASF